jgi:hypothetical protein
MLTDLTSDTLIDVAGLGSGKTRGVVYTALDRAARNGEIPTYVVEPTVPMIRKILVPTFREVLDELEMVRGADYTYNKVDHLLTVRLAGRWCPIQFESSHDPERLKGPNIGTAIVDEAGIHHPDMWRHLPPRCRHPKAAVRQFIAVGTPEGMDTFQEWAEGPWDESKRGSRNVIRAQTYDNTFLKPSPQEYVRTKLSHLDETDIDQYVRGLFVARGTRVYRSFRRDEHGQPTPQGLHGVKFYVGADFNFGKMCWVVGIQRGSEDLHIIGEVVKRDITTEDQARALISYLQERIVRMQPNAYVTTEEIIRRTTIHVDPSARNASVRAYKSDVVTLRDMGFEVWCAHETIPIRDRVMTVNARFRSNHLFVDVAECPELLRTLEKQGRDKMGMPEKHTDPERDLSGSGDGCGYLLWGFPQWRATTPRGNDRARMTGYRGAR